MVFPRTISFSIHAMIANHYFDGGSYPIGGGSKIMKLSFRLLKKIEEKF